MNAKTSAPAPAQSAPSAPVESEPSTLDLAKLISGAAPAAAKKSTAPASAKATAGKPAAEDDPDLDPEHDAEASDDADATGAEADPDTETEAEPEAQAAAEATDEQPAEEPPAEEPAQEPEPEGLDEEDRATRKAFTPEQQKRFDKALFKQREKARREVEQLQAELQEARANPPAPLTPTPDNPLADIASETDLASRETEQRALRRWALTHPQGGTIKGPKGDIEVSAERAAEIIADTEEMLQVHIPARREFLRANAQIEREALQDYPWLKQKTSQGTIAVENMLRHYGNTRLRDIPGIRGSLADLFVGQMIRAQSKQQAAAAAAGKKGGAQPPKAPATPAGQRPPPKVAGAVKKTAHASKTVEETGDDPDNAALGALLSR